MKKALDDQDTINRIKPSCAFALKVRSAEAPSHSLIMYSPRDYSKGTKRRSEHMDYKNAWEMVSAITDQPLGDFVFGPNVVNVERKMFEELLPWPSRVDFASFEKRLKSFEKWSLQLDPAGKKLAETGFFYTKEGDECVPFCCGLLANKWRKGDDPWDKHLAGCNLKTVFIRGFERRAEIENKTVWCNVDEQNFGELVFGVEGIKRRALEKAIPYPDNPDMMTLEARMNSMEYWPIQMKQSKENVAKAGFYYLGDSDSCKAFCCGLYLHRWTERDDPVAKHRRYMRSCPVPKLFEGMFNFFYLL
jgi:hypothetical protein